MPWDWRSSCATLLAAGAVGAGAGPAAAAPSASASVLGGQPAPSEAYPFFVALSVGCGGTLVSPDRVLTAAHCLSELEWDRLRVYVGARRARSSTRYDGREVAVADVASHRRFGRSRAVGSGHDIALIRLAEPVTDVSPVRLLPAGRGPASGRAGTVVGFGVAEIRNGRQYLPRDLRHGPLRVSTDRLCARYYRRTFRDGTMVCARTRDLRGRSTSPCIGDSGGPLVVRDGRGRRYPAGVVSSWTRCGLLGEPTVFARVARLRAWIDQREPLWAPTPEGRPQLGGEVVAGGTATCEGVTWRNRPTAVEYRWRVGDQILTPTRAPSRTLPEWAAGEEVECRVAARNPGGLVRSHRSPVVVAGRR